MTYLNQLMRARRLTKAELSRKSGIPDTTIFFKTGTCITVE